MTKLVDLLLWITAAGNALFGLVTLFNVDWAARTIGFTLQTAGARGEMRAVYGGLVLALGVVMFIALAKAECRQFLLPVALIFAGLVCGRLVSFVADGFSRYTLIIFLIELAAAVLSYIGLRQ